MNGLKNTLAALTLCCVFVSVCVGQNALPERDARFVTKLKQELGLSPAQATQVDSLYSTCNLALQIVEAEIDRIEASEASEREINIRVSIKSQEKKDLKAEREQALLRILTEDQRTAYATDIKPAKPAVLHFGIHNRADCKVCAR